MHTGNGHLQQIGPMTAGLAIQAGGLVLGLRDA